MLAKTFVTMALLTAAHASAASAAQTKAPAAPATAVKIESIAGGLSNPWAVEVLPDGRFLVTERPGQMKLISGDGKKTAVIEGVPKVVARGQGGLLDVALAPDFASSGIVYMSYSEPRDEGSNGTSVAKAKLMLVGDGGRLENLRVIFQQQPSAASQLHFGSRIVFARDGTLFITLGERGSLSEESQNPANHIGKIVHITAEGEPAASNPKMAGWDAKIWSIGHRNVQGAILHPETGELWNLEHGARGGDELNRPQAGKNYGWPVITYGRDYSGDKIGVGSSKEGLEQPVYYWDPSIAVSGLEVYTGDLFKGWKGNLLVGSLKGSQVQRLVMENGEVAAQETLLEDLGERIRDVRQAPDGSVLILTDSSRGQLLRLKPAP